MFLRKASITKKSSGNQDKFKKPYQVANCKMRKRFYGSHTVAKHQECFCILIKHLISGPKDEKFLRMHLNFGELLESDSRLEEFLKGERAKQKTTGRRGKKEKKRKKSGP